MKGVYPPQVLITYGENQWDTSGAHNMSMSIASDNGHNISSLLEISGFPQYFIGGATVYRTGLCFSHLGPMRYENLGIWYILQKGETNIHTFRTINAL
jgi:hypothetical protein